MAYSRGVIVVGGGPVGLALAVDLGLRGVPCTVIERRTEPHRIPKGQNLTQRTLELFHSWGIADELRLRRTIPAEFPGNFIVAYGDLTSGFWYSPVTRKAVDEYFSQRGERLPQYLTEQVLRERLAGLAGVSVRSGWSAEAIRQSDNRAAVDVAGHDGSRRETLSADYVVGCDGSRSLVRESAGLPSSGTDYEQAMVLAVFRSRALHEGLKRFPPAYIYRVVHRTLRGYWRFFGRVDNDGGWFFHAPVPAGADRSEESVRSLLHRAAGFEFACAFDHIGYWDLRVSVADRFRAGRVFIAGDAAHSHPPYGGYGLNTGFEDAANLGWKLAAALQGWGGEALLDSYSEERQAVAADTAQRFIDARIAGDRDFFDRFNPEDDAEMFPRHWEAHRRASDARALHYAPHYEGSSVVAGPPGGICGAKGVHSVRARPGHRLAPWRLSSGIGVHELLGRGFALLALDAGGGAIEMFESAAAQRSVPFTAVREPSSEARRRYGAGLILVRPDGYVAWVGNAPPRDAGSILAKAAGAAAG